MGQFDWMIFIDYVIMLPLNILILLGYNVNKKYCFLIHKSNEFTAAKRIENTKFKFI